MNAVICFKSALRTRSGLVLSSIFAAAAALWVSSCAPSGQPGMGSDRANYSVPLTDASAGSEAAKPLAAASPTADATRSAPGKVSESEAFAKPVKERPGLATQWGGSVKSPMGDTRFTRASTKPYGVDAIYYNDAEGLTAMGAKSYRIDAMQSAAGGVVEWGLRGSFGMLPTYRSHADTRRYIEGKNGATYSIVIKNCCKSRVQVVLSVDGLDVLDGKPAGTKRPGYVISPGDTLEIKGFRTSYEAVAAFKFSSVSQSYAQTRHGDTRNVGVIGLAAYLEQGSDPWKWMPKEIQLRDTANPFATER